MKKVIVVGAGPGGLATSMLLAKAGVKVTILEKQGFVGGRTSTHGEGGYKFDLGPTFFLYPQVLKSIFKAVGRNLETEVEMKRLDPQYQLLFGDGGSIRATPNIEEMVRQVAKISPTDAAQFPRFLTENRDKLKQFKFCLEEPFRGLKDILRWPVMRLLPTLRPWLSLDQELARYFTDPRIRLAFSFQSKYLGMSPFQCPSLFSILSFLEYEHGVWHPMGGCGSVSQAMARVATDMGVDIRLNQTVERISFSGKKATGVVVDGKELKADAVVVNGDFSKVVPQLIPNEKRGRWTDTKIEKSKFSCSTFMMYLGVDREFPELAHHTIFMSKDYQRNLKDIENDHVLTEDPSFYIHNPCVTDPSMAPRGHSSLYVLVPVSHQHKNINWATETPAFRARTLDQIKKVFGIDLEGSIRHERLVTPNDWEHQYSIYRGATFSMAHNLGQMLHLRPQNRFASVDGVYLTGGGTHPGSGLPVIYESARISSRMLLQDLGLPWNHCRVPGPEEDLLQSSGMEQASGMEQDHSQSNNRKMATSGI